MQSMKILLVEDDKGITRFVKQGLIENSFLVDVAFDGEEGDLILLSKFDMTQIELKRTSPDLPAIMFAY